MCRLASTCAYGHPQHLARAGCCSILFKVFHHHSSAPKKSTITCFNDFRPVALTPIMMMCFERLVKNHITSALPPAFDLYQFAYRPNRSTEDAISSALHLTLVHLEDKNMYECYWLTSDQHLIQSSPAAGKQTQPPGYQHPDVQLAAGLPYQPTTVSEGGNHHLQLHLSLYRDATRMCSESTAVYAIDT